MGTAVIVEAGDVPSAGVARSTGGRAVSAGKAAEPLADVNTFGGVGRKR